MTAGPRLRRIFLSTRAGRPTALGPRATANHRISEELVLRTTHVHLHALASYLPERVDLAEAVRRGDCPAEHVDLHELKGVTIAGDLPAPEMALRAARTALDRAGGAAPFPDLLLYADSWHQGPDGWQPQYYLQRHLHGEDTLAVEIRHGCNGMFSALELAAGSLRAGDHPRTALLVAADNFGTPRFDRWRSGPGYVAGDGAGAVVLGTTPGFASLLAVRSAAVSEAEQLHRGFAPLFPPSATKGEPLDFASAGEEFRKRMRTRQVDPLVMVRIQQRTLDVVHATLDEAGTDLDGISRVAYMNYARDIVEQRCTAALGLPFSASTWEFGSGVGHLGAADQIVSLEHLVRTGQTGPGDRVLLLGVGPGVTISAAVVQITQLPAWGG